MKENNRDVFSKKEIDTCICNREKFYKNLCEDCCKGLAAFNSGICTTHRYVYKAFGRNIIDKNLSDQNLESNYTLSPHILRIDLETSKCEVIFSKYKFIF